MTEDVSLDKLLDGRVVLHQATKGYRVAIDPIFLAAAVPAVDGDTILDIGCGTGAAALCLAVRVPGVTVLGLELQPEMVRLADRNVNANDLNDRIRIIQGDVMVPPDGIYESQFNHVMANPPFMAAQSGNPPPDPVRATAMIESPAGIEPWIAFASSVLKPKGTFTMVHRADRLTGILTALQGRFGDIRIFPLWPGPGMEKPAKRLLIQARKGVNAPLELLPGMILHEEDGKYTPDADGVLRHAVSITL